jgi:hypothetical protein
MDPRQLNLISEGQLLELILVQITEVVKDCAT